MDYSNMHQQPPSYGQHRYGAMQYAAPQLSYGGFWIRVLAYIIDAILLVVAQLILMALTDDEATLTIVNLGVGWLYFAGLESAMGGTVGKLLLGMRVTTEQGSNISFLRATGRYFAKFLSALILLIGFIMVGFDKHKQGLHDKIAGTYVIKP